ncbi:MAG TPA: hypothetical protein VMC81_08135 [Rhodocyclaceae bacterium]|nr:hypothetical protein [Rhodocyclaceae bacterium]
MATKIITLEHPAHAPMFGTPDLGPLTEIPARGPVHSTAEEALRWSWRVALTLLSLLLVALAWLVYSGAAYKAGDDIGYNMGLVGGLMMLSLLLYPLRKRVRFMSHLGSMKGWFRYHQAVGIIGPLLVLFHSTFHIGAMNSRVALYAMLLVAVSGLVGRFLYRHIHKDMYGQHLSMRDAEGDLKTCSEDVRTVFAEYPAIEAQLKEFRVGAFAGDRGPLARFWRFMTMKSRGHRLSLAIRDQIKRAMVQAKREKRLTKTQRILAYHLAKDKADAYVEAVCKASQLASWERLFSLWHVVHVPFLYLLVVSGIVHVVAVHMY